jgi:hypothetical protein
MLAFFAIRGIPPDEIIGKGALTQRFYYHAMEVYYEEENNRGPRKV